ncbi:atlastin-1-like isoform X2 [Rhipicephalus microplus]|uniref:atlastin-1-like isoform X2 n=2 Tax=Rhipicephalus microplus TaxID=6941 RepID=UPI003F6AA4CB
MLILVMLTFAIDMSCDAGCATILGPTMGGEPVQILRVEDGKSIVFNERVLKEVLLAARVKDRPVVVVSIAGAYRQGKSFLLNFLLTYLRNNGRPSWIEDKTTPLSGFNWRPGSTRETTGILLWNEVFLMTNLKGEEVAVLLMDTQGTFDCESTTKESTMIFSLSMMISSVQIYNIINNIKEDDLQHLQFFAEYGRLAQKDNQTQAFQKLLFLVRDWNWGHEHEHGYSGGKSLLAGRLKTTDGQDAELKAVRQNILSCFSDIDCFLMPHPGRKVVADKSFDGRLEDIEEEFREKLRELVLSILAPENLLVKEINGRPLSCHDLLIFFKAHVDVFKGGDLPNPTSMLMASANATNMAAVDKATKRYMSGMTNRPRRNLDQLREFHMGLLAEAVKVFDESPKMGGETMSSPSKDLLTKELEELYRHFYEEEKELIRIEMEAEDKRERERQEEKKREEQRQKERIAEKERSEAREKEIQKEREAFKDKETAFQAQEAASKAKLEKLTEEMALERKQARETEEKITSEMRAKDAEIESLRKSIGKKEIFLEVIKFSTVLAHCGTAGLQFAQGFTPAAVAPAGKSLVQPLALLDMMRHFSKK